MNKYNGFFVSRNIIAFIGVILLLLTDFGGYYYRDYYNNVDFWGYIFFGSGFLSSVLILLGVYGLSMPLKDNIKLLKMNRLKNEALKKNVRLSNQGAKISLGLSVCGALVLFLTSYNIDWWLDAGFYGSFFASLLVLYFNKQMILK